MKHNHTMIATALLGFGLAVAGCDETSNDFSKDSEPWRAISEDLIAFPGAEGCGCHATGGRGGDVYHVTTLDDTGASGSLRYAVTQTGARTIVFDVAGTINLTTPLDIANGDLTIAGQSAPGDGICIAGAEVRVNASNVIIRYLRFRPGNDVTYLDPTTGDPVIFNGLSGTGQQNIIIDHCSMSWSTDECATFYDNRDFTLQWCIVSESLANSIHEKGKHGYGGIWGGQTASFHHNLLAHHTNRTPRLCGSRYTGKPEDERVELFNNVIYNYGSAYAGEGGSYNFLNNYYKPGPYTSLKASCNRLFTAYADDGKNENKKGTHGVFYFKGNYIDPTCDRLTEKKRKAILKVNEDNTAGLVVKDDFAPKSELLAAEAFDIAEHTTLQPTWDAYESVLLHAGASFRRDKHDARIVDEVRRGTYTYEGSHGSTLGIIDQPSDVGGWGEYRQAPAPADTDGDGMPDEWEKAHGLNPADSRDGAAYNLDPHYTNLEVYLNELVSGAFPA